MRSTFLITKMWTNIKSLEKGDQNALILNLIPGKGKKPEEGLHFYIQRPSIYEGRQMGWGVAEFISS